jgi:hypothetical protein
MMGAQKEALKLAIKDEFLGRLRESYDAHGGDEGLTLSVKWLYEDFLPSLSVKEEAALEEIIAEMIQEGIIAVVNGRRTTFQLTRKGMDLLCL